MSDLELSLEICQSAPASSWKQSTEEIGNIQQPKSPSEEGASLELGRDAEGSNTSRLRAGKPGDQEANYDNSSTSAGETSEEEDQCSSQTSCSLSPSLSPSLSSCSSVCEDEPAAALGDEGAASKIIDGPLDSPSDTFEGPEKTLEVRFRASEAESWDNDTPSVSHERGLRGLSRAQLDRVCEMARCCIMSHISNSHLDAYVLSESSLFVYERKLMMKTCGTTTLLRALSTLCEVAGTVGLELAWLQYSRKNLQHPEAQSAPHRNHQEEVAYLESHPCLRGRMRGQAHVLGPLTGDHWFVYVAEQLTSREGEVRAMPVCAPKHEVEKHGLCLNIMMFDMHPRIAQKFYLDPSLQSGGGMPPASSPDAVSGGDNAIHSLNSTRCPIGAQMTSSTGVDALVPGMQLDEHSFEPCGYSMNAILHDAYSTIHVTPEEQSSYASFETNVPLRSYNALVRNVVHTFQPERFVVTFWCDKDTPHESSPDASFASVALPWQAKTMPHFTSSSASIKDCHAKSDTDAPCYVREGHSSYVDGSTVVQVTNYELKRSAVTSMRSLPAAWNAQNDPSIPTEGEVESAASACSREQADSGGPMRPRASTII